MCASQDYVYRNGFDAERENNTAAHVISSKFNVDYFKYDLFTRHGTHCSLQVPLKIQFERRLSRFLIIFTLSIHSFYICYSSKNKTFLVPFLFAPR